MKPEKVIVTIIKSPYLVGSVIYDIDTRLEHGPNFTLSIFCYENWTSEV